MIRLILVALVIALAASFLWAVIGSIRDRLRRRGPTFTPRHRNYEWEPRTRQIARQLKVGPGEPEDRRRIIAFLDSRAGVEAFVEPRTVMHPLSVVLVAGDGEWTRIALADDRFLRELARSRGLRIHDAARVGYPDRMRRYKRPSGEAPEG